MPTPRLVFLGPCPFLTCLRRQPHTHPVCETCGAARYGNASCETCRGHFDERAIVERDDD